VTWWVVGLVLLAVAGLSIYGAFRSPAFVAGLTALASAAAWKVVKPVIIKQRTPEQQAKDQAEYKAGRGDDYWRRRSGAPPKG
jgi:hypothetical protein